jgi:hypothetical protein
LTFEHADPGRQESGKEWKADAIFIRDSSIIVENCSATSATGNGIGFYGFSALSIFGNRCNSSKGSGIVFSGTGVGHGDGEAIGNICEKNAQDGISLTFDSPSVSGNQLSQNGGYGLSYDEA